MKNFIFILSIIILYSCSSKKELPFYGMSIVNSPLGQDTIKNKIPQFLVTNQMNQKVSHIDFEGKPFVIDFFFTSCPGICPKMTRNMLKVYEEYKTDLNFISHSIDPKRDTVERLYSYAKKIGIENADSWHFVRAPKEEISALAESYMILAYEDSTASGGFEHGGQFVLVDQNQFVRGFYDGLDDESVDKLLDDIKILLKEN